MQTVGKVAALLELGSGFHPELSGRDNVFLNGSILGLSRKALEAKFDDIVGFAGLERFIDTPVKNYSSGMYVRLGFSVAINVDPDVLLVDEVLAVGDASFQRRCLEKFAEFRRAGKTVVIVSHDAGSMKNMCDEVAWLDQGVLLETGKPVAVLEEYEDDGHEDRIETDDGGTRWGSGEAAIEKMELLDADGTASATGSGPASRSPSGCTTGSTSRSRSRCSATRSSRSTASTSGPTTPGTASTSPSCSRGAAPSTWCCPGWCCSPGPST